MIFQYGNSKAIIDEKEFVLLFGENQLMKLSTANLMQYSVTRPFSMDSNEWAFVSKEEKEDTAAYSYQCGDIVGTLTFSVRENALNVTVRFTNTGSEEMADFTGSVVIPVTGRGKNNITLPHMIYNDNPSAVPEKIVPHIGDEVGGGIIVEEHRLPIPAVNAEWMQDGIPSYITLLSVPAVVTGDEREYWSLGVVKEEDGETLTALSGPLMFNGMKDVVYGGRNTPMSWLKGYRYIRSNEFVEKSFCIAWGQLDPVEGIGKGFRNITELGYTVLKPQTVRNHTLDEMVDYKKNVLDSRYYKDENCCGYMTFGSANKFGNVSGRPEYFLYGWTGQCIKLAWCDCVLGLTTDETFRFDRGFEVADFFVKNGQHKEIPGLFYGYYLIEKQEWRGVWKDASAALASRIEGESISDLIDIMTLMREHGREIPEYWLQAVKDACAFFMDEKYQTEDGIYPMGWEVDGSISNPIKNAAGMPCVLALAKASEFFQEPAYLEYAKKKYAIYADMHMKTFEIPFARATMDAKCEDKEAGLYFFEAAAELYRLTKEEQFKTWAEIAGDWILTFVFFWETGFAKDTPCAKKNFKTTGWPGVSVQNHHMDVFFPSFDMYQFGKLAGIAKFEEMGKNVCAALTYGVCTEEGEWGFSVVGEQGEHYYHTNYFQVRYPNVMKHMSNWRGGMQVWNPSWITAQVFSSTLRFKLDGHTF